MLKLYGYAGSIYSRVVKLALLEKGLAFDEVAIPLRKDGSFVLEAGYLDKSPMGKLPCLETSAGTLTETSAILDYLDDLCVFGCEEYSELKELIMTYKVDSAKPPT